MKQSVKGVNVIRIFMSADLWRENREDKSSTPYRTIIKEALSIAEEEGFYVIMVMYNIGKDANTYGNFNPFWKHSFFGGKLSGAVDFMKSWMTELKGHPNALFEIWNEPVLPAMSGSSSTNWDKSTFMNGYKQIIQDMRSVSDHIIVINIAWGANKNRPHMQYYQELSDLAGPEQILYDIHSYDGGWGGWGDAGNPSQSGVEAYWRDIGLIDSPVPLVIGELAPKGKDQWDNDDWQAAESILKVIEKYPINFCLELWRWGYDYYHILKQKSDGHIYLFGDGYSRWGKLVRQYLADYEPPI
jgi:hypothetical protein